MKNVARRRNRATDAMRSAGPAWEIAKRFVGVIPAVESSFRWSALSAEERDACLVRQAGEYLLSIPRLGAQRPAVSVFSRAFVTRMCRSVTRQEIRSYQRAAVLFNEAAASATGLAFAIRVALAQKQDDAETAYIPGAPDRTHVFEEIDRSRVDLHAKIERCHQWRHPDGSTLFSFIRFRVLTVGDLLHNKADIPREEERLDSLAINLKRMAQLFTDLALVDGNEPAPMPSKRANTATSSLLGFLEGHSADQAELAKLKRRMAEILVEQFSHQIKAGKIRRAFDPQREKLTKEIRTAAISGWLDHFRSIKASGARQRPPK